MPDSNALVGSLIFCVVILNTGCIPYPGGGGGGPPPEQSELLSDEENRGVWRTSCSSDNEIASLELSPGNHGVRFTTNYFEQNCGESSEIINLEEFDYFYTGDVVVESVILNVSKYEFHFKDGSIRHTIVYINETKELYLGFPHNEWPSISEPLPTVLDWDHAYTMR